MEGPLTEEEWKSAIKLAKGVLGLPEKYNSSQYVIDLFINVNQIEKVAIGGEI